MTAQRPALIEGYVEEVSARKVAGWAWRVGSDDALDLGVFVDGAPAGRVTANGFRPDLLQSGKGDGCHAFHHLFAEPIAPGGVVEVRVRGADRVLAYTDTLVERLRAGVADPTDDPLISPGDLDQLAVEDGQLIGAAVIEEVHPAVFVTIDGVSIGQARVDPGSAGAGTQLARGGSFRLAVPPALLDGQTHRVMVLNARDRRRLDGGAMALRFPLSSPTPAPVLVTTPPTPPASVTPTLLVTTAAARDAARGRCLAIIAAAIVLPPIAAEGAAAVIAQVLALAHPPSVLLVSPPTPATLLAAALLRELHGGAMIVDIEAATAADDAALAPLPDRLDAAAGFDAPAWAGIARRLIDAADGVIVADPALRANWGGMLVRTGCDEARFDPAAHDRAGLRAAAGWGATDRVLLAQPAGLPAREVMQLVEAMEHCADPALLLCLAGPIADADLRAYLDAGGAARIARLDAAPPLPDAPLLAIADAVWLPPPTGAEPPPLLLAALAMDVTVLTRPHPALADLAAQGLVRPLADAAALAAAMARLAAAPRRGDARAAYLAEFGGAANALRLGLARTHAWARRGRADPPTRALLRRLQDEVAAIATSPEAPAGQDG